MAHYIEKHNNIIKLNRGDYFKFPLELSTRRFPVEERWELEEGDVVFFALMDPQHSFECALLKKELTKDNVDSEGTLWVTFYPEDTMNLIPGKYYYQVKMLYTVEDDPDVHVDTVIQKTRFDIID